MKGPRSLAPKNVRSLAPQLFPLLSLAICLSRQGIRASNSPNPNPSQVPTDSADRMTAFNMPPSGTRGAGGARGVPLSPPMAPIRPHVPTPLSAPSTMSSGAGWVGENQPQANPGSAHAHSFYDLESRRPRRRSNSFTMKVERDVEEAAASLGTPGHRWLLLRHGQTDANAEGRVQGSTDFSRLTEEGQRQARQAGEFVATLDIDKVYVSPLTRARQTLELVEESGRKLNPAEVIEDLREIDLYEWEGMLKQDIKDQFPEVYQKWRGNDAKEFKLDSGPYPIRELWARAEKVWTYLMKQALSDSEDDSSDSQGEPAKRSPTALLTAHNGVHQAMLCTAIGMNEDCFRKFEFPNCGMAEIIWVPGEPMARQWRWIYPTESSWHVVNAEDANEEMQIADQDACEGAGSGDAAKSRRKSESDGNLAIDSDAL